MFISCRLLVNTPCRALYLIIVNVFACEHTLLCLVNVLCDFFNILRPEQNGWHFAYNIFRCIFFQTIFTEQMTHFHMHIFFKGNVYILMQMSLKSVHLITDWSICYMMTSSNGNIFRVTGHLCGNSPVPGEFPAQRPVTRSFDVFFDQRLNKRLSKQSYGWWFETLSCPLWRHSNEHVSILSMGSS